MTAKKRLPRLSTDLMRACEELGLRAVWVNRRGETGNLDWQPYAQVADLNSHMSPPSLMS